MSFRTWAESIDPGRAYFLFLIYAAALCAILVALMATGYVSFEGKLWDVPDLQRDPTIPYELPSGQDITPEFVNASVDSIRECNKDDNYSVWTRYVCVYNITYDAVTKTERERGATARMYEYFHYSYIFNDYSINLQPRSLYYIEYELQLGYCSGPGRIISAKKVSDHACNECTVDPDGRIQGCCADIGCKSKDGRVS